MCERERDTGRQTDGEGQRSGESEKEDRRWSLQRGRQRKKIYIYILVSFHEENVPLSKLQQKL